MSATLRWSTVFVLFAMLVPELGRQRGEWQLAQAHDAIARVLSGRDSGATALARLQLAEAQSSNAGAALDGDVRALLIEALATMAMQRSDDAIALLRDAVAKAERPELVVNLGRAYFQRGDAAAADQAYLRAAWSSDAALATLPAAMRVELQGRVRALEADLVAGRHAALPPPLPTAR